MRRDQGLNYAALLGVIAAASFAAPLVADLGVTLGLSDASFAPVSLVVAAAIVIGWLVVVRSDRSA
ncbi:MAG TPA: hypothetical protein VFN03_07210 [Trueperaceae bacterium]|nr:hypothetical protein [Trueperaceae bacterium]